MADQIFTSNPFEFTPGDTDNHRIVFSGYKGGQEKIFELKVTAGSFRVNKDGNPNADSAIIASSGNDTVRIGTRHNKTICYVKDLGGSGTIIISQIV